MSRKLTLFIISIFVSLPTLAQRITVGPGNLQNTNIVGPFASNNNKSYGSFAYIYPELSLPGILHMDTIEAIDFQRNGAIGNIPGNCLVRIWLQNTSNPDFGAANINFAALRNNINAQLVFDGVASTLIDSTLGFKKFPFLSKYAYDTSLGKNLVMFIEYEQDSFPAASISWNADNTLGVPSYANNQVKFARDTASVPTISTGSSSIHPQIRLDIPRADFEGKILIPYTCGKFPVPLGNQDTIKLRVINLGKKDAQAVKIFVRSRGANEFVDSVTTNMPRFRDTIITFPTRGISNIGMDTLTFELPADSSIQNNTREHIRQATLDIYSYRLVSEPLAPGGIGFNGSTGNFVCKFASNDKKLINQIEVNFGFVGQPFRVGIWEYDTITGQPDSLLWQSDSLTSSNTSTIPIFPPVEVNGNFYTGVRQLGTLNVSFGYQLESPVRPQTFWYSAPLASTNWIDFAPAAPFRFAIEPRTQAEFDVMAFDIVQPIENDTIAFFDFDTIRPAAEFYNLGASDMDTLIPFKCEMYIGNFKVLDIVKWDSISSGRIKTISFDTAFVPPFSGEYRVLISPNWEKDSLSLNDSLEYTFTVAVFDDVNMELIFSPQQNAVIEFKRDTIKPLFRIRNSAFNNAINFWSKVTIKGKKSGLVYADSSFTPILEPRNNNIISTKDWPATIIDSFEIVFTTELPDDSNKDFDTMRRSFIVRKTIDLKTDSILHPAVDIAYSSKIPLPKPRLRIKNDGIISPVSSTFFIEIRDDNNTLLHDDSFFNVAGISPGNTITVSFSKDVNITKRGVYSILAYHKTENDFETIQDSISGVFYYGFERDAQADSILNPTNLLKYELGEGTFLVSGRVSNQGFDSMRNTSIKMEALDSIGNIIYISGQTITLDSNESEVVNFNNITFNAAGKVEMRLITLLNKDQNITNDTLRKFFQVKVSNDVGLDSIYNFTDEENLRAQSVFRPSVLINNYGLNNQNNGFIINYQVRNSNTATVIYDETETASLDSGEQKVHVFNQTLPLTDSGSFTASARVLLNTDQRLNNDLKTQDFNVIYGSNISIADSFPKSGFRYGPYIPSTNIAPLVKLSKTGDLVLPDSGKVFIEINAINTSYNYFDSVSYKLYDNKDTFIQFTKVFDNTIRDSFNANIWVLATENDFLEDDSINFGFRVDFATSLDLLEEGLSVGPNPGNGIYTISVPSSFLNQSYQVYNTDGKEVLNGEITKMENRLDLQFLPAGVYFLHLNKLKLKLVKK